MGDINNIEIKSIQKDSNVIICGYASTFGNLDKHNDIIAKGAFKESLSNDSCVKFLWQHEYKKPVGKILKIYEDDIGLFFEAEIFAKLALSKDAIELIKSDVLDSVSIGFKVVESYLDDESNRVITKAKLFEISLVTFPANEKSKIKLKSNKQEIDNKIIIESINNAKITLKNIKEVINGRG